MRILQLLRSRSFGGAEIHALTLMLELHKLGHELVYAGLEGSWLQRECSRHAMPWIHVPMRGLLDVASIVSLRRLVREWRPQIVHGHLVRGAHYAGLAAFGFATSVAVCTAHATTARKHMGQCDRIIAVSDAVAAQLALGGHRAPRVMTIHNGMSDGPPGDRERLRAELGIAPSTFAAVCAARFIEDKGQDLLVRTASRLPSDCIIHLLGDASTTFGRKVSVTAGNDPRIRFLGYRDDVQRLLPAFDAYVSASRREALSLSLIEAAAASLPIVATAVGGIPEVVPHGRCGLLVPPDNAGALGAALLRLRDEPALAQRLGESARQRYLERFTATRMAKQTLALYAQTASSPAHARAMPAT